MSSSEGVQDCSVVWSVCKVNANGWTLGTKVPSEEWKTGVSRAQNELVKFVVSVYVLAEYNSHTHNHVSILS